MIENSFFSIFFLDKIIIINNKFLFTMSALIHVGSHILRAVAEHPTETINGVAGVGSQVAVVVASHSPSIAAGAVSGVVGGAIGSAIGKNIDQENGTMIGGIIGGAVIGSIVGGAVQGSTGFLAGGISGAITGGLTAAIMHSDTSNCFSERSV